MGRDDPQRTRDRDQLRDRGVSALALEQTLEQIYVAAEGAALRQEERRKAVQVAALLDELAAVLPRRGKGRRLTVVDAAAGKAYVGLLAARHVLPVLGTEAAVVVIEREAERVESARRAAQLLGAAADVSWRVGDVGDAALWPAEPDAVLALHACGPAADLVIDRAVAARARSLLLVPCCTGAEVRAMPAAERAAERMSIPRHAPVRRRFLQSFVDAERTLRLEAAGYKTEVIELVPPTVTPHNLMWRARRVGEPRRAADASRALTVLLGSP